MLCHWLLSDIILQSKLKSIGHWPGIPSPHARLSIRLPRGIYWTPGGRARPGGRFVTLNSSNLSAILMTMPLPLPFAVPTRRGFLRRVAVPFDFVLPNSAD